MIAHSLSFTNTLRGLATTRDASLVASKIYCSGDRVRLAAS